jgi:hypothetical protein
VSTISLRQANLGLGMKELGMNKRRTIRRSLPLGRLVPFSCAGRKSVFWVFPQAGAKNGLLSRSTHYLLKRPNGVWRTRDRQVSWDRSIGKLHLLTRKSEYSVVGYQSRVFCILLVETTKYTCSATVTQRTVHFLLSK